MRRFSLYLGLLLGLTLLAGQPSAAGAATKDGCTYLGYGSQACQYRATGPGSYVAYLESGYAEIRVNGRTRVEIYPNSAERGGFAAARGDVVQLVVRQASCEFCFPPPAAGLVRVRNR